MTNEELLKVIEKAKRSRETRLDLRNRGITTLPPEIGQLTSLTWLYLLGNQLTTLPTELFQLKNLIWLSLSNNQLTSLPSEISQLTNLIGLFLGNNQLTSLPSEIGQLTNLTELSLGNNQLTTLPSEICRLTKLRQLNLSHNPFVSPLLEISLEGIEAIREYLTNEELLKEIEEVKVREASVFNLSGRGLTSLPPEIGKLRNLQELDLRNNQLTSLPPEIAQLTRLTELDLQINKFATLPSGIGKLTSLTFLYLNNNQLTSLPPEITQLTNLKRVWLYDNPLTSPPPEIAKQGIGAIRQYFAELEKSKQPLNEVKVLLIGDGAAGKTSLVKQLLGEKFNEREDTTHGINIKPWPEEVGGQKIKINIWDFGGQEIQHATHQFFLSKRSLYVLVLDGRKDERTEYWLRHVEAFGGDSPVLIVLNKIDSNPLFDVNRSFLLEKYSGIRGFFPISCTGPTGIPEFKEALLDALTKVEMLETIWPGSWFTVKSKLEDMERAYISAEEYRGYCAEASIAEEESQETLVEFLNDLGVAVHFKDIDLKTMHVLDPVWVTEAVYKIITAKEMADSKGILERNALAEILKDQPAPRPSLWHTILRQPCAKCYCFPSDTHSYIMHLMEKFELCYPVDNGAVLIPQLLPVPELTVAFEQRNALRFALHYPDFLPPSVFPRFMVKVHKDIHKDTRWRTGVLLADKRSGSQAVVKVDTEARRINIWVQGETPREYLHYLRYLLTDINSSFEKLIVSERVPMPDDPHVSADYQTLRKCAERGIERYMPDGSDKDYSVHELLGLVQPKDRNELDVIPEKMDLEPAEKVSLTDMLISGVQITATPPFVIFNLTELFKQIRAWDKQRQREARR